MGIQIPMVGIRVVIYSSIFSIKQATREICAHLPEHTHTITVAHLNHTKDAQLFNPSLENVSSQNDSKKQKGLNPKYTVETPEQKKQVNQGLHRRTMTMKLLFP